MDSSPAPSRLGQMKSLMARREQSLGGRGTPAGRAAVAGQGRHLETLRCSASDVSVRSMNGGPKTQQPVEVRSWK